MKKNFLVPVAVIIALALSFQQLGGQEKTAAQKEKEAKLQEAITLQKKAIADQKLKNLEQQSSEVDQALQEATEDVVKSTGTVNVYSRIRPPRIGRDFGDNSFYVSPDINMGNNFSFFHEGDDGERTTWDFSKYVKEASFSKQYSFDVEKSAETVVMTVMGDCKSGEIRVKIIMPGGKLFSDILIDESGNLNWRKSFTISEDENKDKAGEWLFKIEAVKATGSFKILLQTY